MWFLLVILLGIVQGITEFLPVSSSGHLVLLELLFGTNFNFALLNVFLHLSTLFAVCFYYRKKLKQLILNPFCKTNLYLILATIPAVLFVVLTRSFFDFESSNYTFLGIGFLLTACLLFLAEICAKKNKQPNAIGWKTALLMGIGQAFAVFPGLSRSGTTFSVGVASGAEKNEVLDFSFLMSIPIILASLVYELLFSGAELQFNMSEIWGIVLSCVFAFVFAILGLKLMNKLVLKIKFIWFVPYLTVLGIILLVL